VRIDDPEKRVLPAQAFEVLVDEHTHQAEAEKKTSGSQRRRKNNSTTRIMSQRYYRNSKPGKNENAVQGERPSAKKMIRAIAFEGEKREK
jgi:hypothetical protein